MGTNRPSATLGELLRRHRLDAGLTQEAVARRAGVSIRALRDIEADRVERPRMRSVLRLAAALGLSGTDRDGLLASVAAEPAATAGDLHVGVLGPLVVRRGGGIVEIRARMLRSLLGLLALQPRQLVSKEEIIDVLWGDDPPSTCGSLVHTYVSRLRRLLEPDRQAAEPTILALVEGGYRLELDADRLDLARFDQLSASGRDALAAGQRHPAQELFGHALRCWRGQLLAGADGRVRAHPAAVAVRQRRVATALAYADLAIERGPDEQAIAWLRDVTSAEALHEGLRARLMLALAGRGEQAAALHLFAEIRARLADELGVEPGAELQDAHVRVLRQELGGRARPGAAAAAAPDAWAPAERAAGPVPPAQLPADVTSFTGRADQLERLDELLAGADDRQATAVVVTALTGSAGIGKTALAVHWAHRVRDRFPDGQLYVNLHGYAAAAPPLRPIDALARLLHALDVRRDQVPVDVEDAAGLYRTLLAGRRVLVVLDNASGADQVRPLLPGHPGCFVLITSRDRLTGLVAHDGARTLALDVLTEDEARSMLVRILGAERVEAEPDAAAELARLCARLPLALRIAAANLSRDPHRPIGSYAAELATSDRLVALTVEGDQRSAVRAAFDLSYERLDPDARRLFRLLGAAPVIDATADAAAALAGIDRPPALRLLVRLAAAHLIDQHAPGRFAFHDLLRLYAADRAEREDEAGEPAAAMARLYDHYLGAVDAAASRLYPQTLRLPIPAATTPAAPDFPDHVTALAWLDAERPNLVAAIRHTAEHGPRPVAWLLADGMRGYFYLRRVDWLVVGQAALGAAVADGDLRAQVAAHRSIAQLHYCGGRYQLASSHSELALAIAERAEWVEAQASILNNLGSLANEMGRPRQAVERLRRALALYEQLDRPGGRAAIHHNLGTVSMELGRLTDAADHTGKALALFRAIGSRGSEANSLSILAEISRWLGFLDRALDVLAQASALYREVGSRGDQAEADRFIAAAHRDAGRYALARKHATAALDTSREVGARRYEAEALTVLGSIHHELGEHGKAADHVRQALQVSRDSGLRYPRVDAEIALAAVLHGLGQADQATARAQTALADAREAGYRLLEGQALTNLATIQLGGGGSGDEAIRTAEEALAIHRETGYRLGEARTELLLASALAGQRPAAAVDRRRRALALFHEIGAPVPEDRAGRERR